MARYFRPAGEMPDIYLYRPPIDFRKAAQGLAAIVAQELGHDPFAGALYAFTNRQRTKIKMPVLGRQWLCAVLQSPGGREVPLAANGGWRGDGADGPADQLAAGRL
ncbi:IS66 Orf2 family protein [Thiothrix nivea DSM 5205]|uniref:IS66 Orf2 family protein n=1 Tax=Thiothrix nivea (strain ATCC 35100 / DSM 5205 / JP2) TaxID=870187 RepID=A0A656HEK6_THINJ|nr:IS66 family insertion sequence element accessory protein TnpB [Thiothrix nivea]EIJ34847.1 IS66 Orf2 family protein [Thiothrix nivea DSM 5205]